ncbi:MAG: cupin domain-containing protein [Pyrinomonadaceae bacterium]|nr:cupin domain-containing protein [Pyrinomonadaceae bacterium]
MMKYHSVAEEETEERAALYALGALSQHEARAFEEHLAEGCEACEAIYREFENTVGALAFAAPEASPSPIVREKLSALLAEETKEEHSDSRLPQSVPAQFLTLRNEEGEWQKVADGILAKQLFVDPKARTVTSLFRMMPGTRIPTHRHQGVEQCYIIEGDFHADDEALGPGDFHCALAGSTHKPVYTIGGALILIVATEGHEVVGQH